MTVLAQNLQRRREFIGLSIVGLALESGVPTETIAMIERGRITEPSFELVARLAMALHTDAHDLLCEGAGATRPRFSLLQGGRRREVAAAGPEVA